VTGASERPELPDLHERILGLFDRGCDTPLHGFAFPIAWRAVPRHSGCCQRGIRFSASVMAPT